MPWRQKRTPYRVLVSEIMLQQTSVPMVTPRYSAFLGKFPSFKALAAAPVQEVLRAWKGLGYNRRALALLQSARIVASVYRGRLPRTVEELVQLPGVGPATAAAIIVYAFNIPVAFVETNVRRVFLHFFFPRARNVPDSRILPLVEKTMDRANPRDWFYALMDYGTFLAATARPRRARRGTPAKSADALRRSSRYRRQAAFEGSHRQLRGRVLGVLLQKERARAEEIEAVLGADSRLRQALAELVTEGFLQVRGGTYSFPQPARTAPGSAARRAGGVSASGSRPR